MKLLDRMHIWDIKREIKSYESKIRLIKAVIKHIKKENA